MTVVGTADTNITVNLPPNQNAVADPTGRIMSSSGDAVTLDAQEVALIPSVFNQNNATGFTGAQITGDKPISVSVATFAHLRRRKSLHASPPKNQPNNHMGQSVSVGPGGGKRHQLSSRGRVLENANEDDTVVQFMLPSVSFSQ